MLATVTDGRLKEVRQHLLINSLFFSRKALWGHVLKYHISDAILLQG